MPMISALLTQPAAKDVTEALRGQPEAPHIAVVQPGGGPIALADAARVPADVLILDAGSGPGLGAAVLRYRILRPTTRIVLLAQGRVPGDAEVAAVVHAGVYDVATDPTDLPAVLASAPAGIEAAARWIDPSLAPEARQGQRVVERVVERRVAVSQRPVVIAVAGIAQGVGTTTLAAAVAGFLARSGHGTAFIEANQAPSLAILSQVRIGEQWLPNLTVFPNVNLQAAREIEQTRQYPYLVVDLGAPPRSVISEVDADLLLICLTSDVHRWPRVVAWLHQQADTSRAQHADDQALTEAIRADQALPKGARYVLVSPTTADTRDLAQAWEAATERCIPPTSEPLFPIPIADRTAWPAGYRRPDPALDTALGELLAPVLPDGPAPRRGLFSGFRSRPKPRRLPPAAEGRAPEPSRPTPAQAAPRAPAARAAGGQHITVRVGDGASALDRITGVLETAWRLALGVGACYGVLFVLSRVPGAPPWAGHGLAWANGVLAAGWRAVGGH